MITLVDSVIETPADFLATGLEIAGLLVIGVGGIIAAIRAAMGMIRERRSPYTAFRRDFARALIVGLEILVAADIVLTVVVDRTLEATLVLGLLVLVRVVLGWTLEIEINGFVPWNRWRFEEEKAPIN